MLSHLVVLDLTRELGAFAGTLLARLGADVRRAAHEDDAFAWNECKEGVALDPRSPQGRAALQAFAAESDIVLLGDEWVDVADDLVRDHPRLIVVVLEPFGSSGPYAAWPAANLNLMALSGLMNIVGDPDRAPLNLPGDQALALTGIQATIAALLGVAARHRTGRGQRVDVSALQSTVLANYRDPLVFEWTGRLGGRTGNKLVRGKTGVRQVWQCRDGYITWGMVDNPGMLKGIVTWLAEQGYQGELLDVDWTKVLMADMPQDTIDRWEEIIASYFLKASRSELARLSTERGWGLMAINEMADVLGSEHLAARDFWRQAKHPTQGDITLPGRLFQTSE
jgi:crotonobetainyl-CoA:carnitine CoA-transferase CaiB-like acyl-CoA transferase